MLVQYNNGPLNDIVLILGGEKIAWLSNEYIALGIIILVNTIQFMGISMILYLAGLQSIPDMYYEAASIDGAKKWDCFFSHYATSFIPCYGYKCYAKFNWWTEII